MIRALIVLLVTATLMPDWAKAQVFRQQPSAGKDLFDQHCASCHQGGGDGRAPAHAAISGMSARAIMAALEDGVMREQGKALDDAQKRTVAEWWADAPLLQSDIAPAAMCQPGTDPGRNAADIAWTGWGGNPGATGFRDEKVAGLSADQVPSLTLKWAFGFPGAIQSRSKPAVVGGRLLVGSATGDVYALDATSGCVHWVFSADAAVRGGIQVGRSPAGKLAAWFVDFRTNVYALDVSDGSLLWRNRVAGDADNSNTGTVAYHDGRLFVPLSSMEVLTARNPEYECCQSSGAVVALDAGNGEELWRHRVIGEPPRPSGRNARGTVTHGPSGAPVWSSPTVDARRGRIYFGTGENYSHPASDSSDALIALDMKTGRLVWQFQATQDDTWNLACGFTTPENCPAPMGPDVDFGMAPILVTTPGGRDVLLAGQKSGVVWALDPDRDGARLWSTKIGKGSALGGIHWGMASDGRVVFAPNSDSPSGMMGIEPDHPASPGLFALDVSSGNVLWYSAPPDDACHARPGCVRALSAAPTAIPGVVFSGGLDGHLRAYSTDDGRVLWAFDTVRDFTTVNGVAARGGAIDGPGPVIANRMVYSHSGYGLFGQMPGNVLLAFAPGDTQHSP